MPVAVAAVWGDIDLGAGIVVAVDATHGWTGGAKAHDPFAIGPCSRSAWTAGTAGSCG